MIVYSFTDTARITLYFAVDFYNFLVVRELREIKSVLQCATGGGKVKRTA